MHCYFVCLDSAELDVNCTRFDKRYAEQLRIFLAHQKSNTSTLNQ